MFQHVWLMIFILVFSFVSSAAVQEVFSGIDEAGGVCPLAGSTLLIAVRNLLL